MKTPHQPPHRRNLPASPFNNPSVPVIEEFAVNDRVTHDKFGMGRVVARDVNSVVVAFGTERVRVSVPYRKLTKV